MSAYRRNLTTVLAVALLASVGFGWQVWRAWATSHRAVVMQRDLLSRQRPAATSEAD